MAVTFFKQPGETLDYDFDYFRFMADGDTISSATVTAEAGVTLGTKSINTSEHIVKQFISGGTDGVDYKVTCQATTTGGRIKEAEFILSVRES